MHGAVAPSTSLHVIAVHTRCTPVVKDALPALLPALIIHVFNVKCMYVARKVAKQGEGDVDEEVGAAASDEEDADGRD